MDLSNFTNFLWENKFSIDELNTYVKKFKTEVFSKGYEAGYNAKQKDLEKIKRIKHTRNKRIFNEMVDNLRSYIHHVDDVIEAKKIRRNRKPIIK